MADNQEETLVKGPLLNIKISQTLYEIKELEVSNHELSCLHPKKRVYTRQGSGNVFFHTDRTRVVGQFKKKLEDARKELQELNRQKQDAA